MRKRAALARKYKAEQNALPLLAVVVAADQKPADRVMEERKEQLRQTEQATRDAQAKAWREIRKRYYALSVAERSDIRVALTHYWGKKNIIAYSYYIKQAESGAIRESIDQYQLAQNRGRQWRANNL
jgi:hypothetical protein